MAQWPYHAQDEIDAVVEVLKSGKTNYWSGPHGQLFEAEFAAYTGAKHALAVSNGTTALEVALFAIRNLGAEVIVPCRTFMATASSVVTAGMTPVLADIDPKTLNVTVETLEARRTANTLAVIAVHYGGLPCDMPAITAWAEKHSIIVIEDCAHAHGSRIGRWHVGTFGSIGCFSFCVGKIMSTGGEGGMVITNHPEVHKRMAARRDHGRYQMMGSKDMTQFQWTVEEYGTNLRMTEMQSAIGRLQLQKLDGWVRRRNAIANRYNLILDGIETPDNVTHGRYLYMATIDDRDARMARLQEMGVAARLGGCPNIGHEAVFGGMAADCPNADGVGERTLSLPVYPTMTNDEVEKVCDAVKIVCA